MNLDLTSVSALEVQGDLVVVVGSDLSKVLVGEVAQLLVSHAACAGHHHAGSLVVGLHVVDKIVPGRKCASFKH